MKKILLSISLASSVLFTGCDVLTAVADTALDTAGGGAASNALTNDEVIAGLKEALTVGIKNGAGMASKMDGFLKNSEIRLPFPPDAQKVKDKAIDLGLQNKVDDFETTLNRAAEEACKEAAPIFIDAIKNMSISDGFTILKGSDNAATNYLKDKTTASLKTAFSPKVQAAIDKVQLTKYWEPLTKAYNTSTLLSGKEEVNTDLNAYITDRAISGLFLLVEKEENKIRKDPVARVTDILQKVFSTLD